MSDSSLMGWRIPTTDGKEDNWHKNSKLDWTEMVQQVDMYIKSLNFNYVKSLREAKVDYINAYAEFIDPYTVAFKMKPKKRGAPMEDKKLTAAVILFFFNSVIIVIYVCLVYKIAFLNCIRW